MLRILILEDVPSDAALVERELRQGGLEAITRCVETEPDFVAALADFKPDIVLSDYSLPSFNGMDALRLVQQRSPETPLIIVTGSLSEETAAECIKAGAADYVLKERMARLLPAVRGALERQRLEQDKRRAEEALRESEEKYREILENMEESYFEVDLAGNLTFFNEALCRLLGYPRDELLGMNNRQFTDRDHTGKVFQAFNKIYTTGESSREFDWEVVRKDGTRRHIETSASLRRDSSGQPIGFSGLFRDITERKRAEEALRESEERFRSIFDKSNDGILVADATTRKFLFGNRAIYQMLGYTPEELMALGVSEIHPQKDLSAVMEAFDKLVRREIKMAPGLPVKRKDGSVFYADINSFPLQLEGGTRLIGIFRDITERKQAEEALRESEERFRRLTETMPDAVVVGQDGRNVYANSAAARLLRAAGPEELVGLEISRIVDPAQYERARQQMQRALAGEMPPPLEDSFVRLDGSLVPVEIAVSLLTWQGRPALQVVARDITERKRAEEALQESEERYRSLFEQSPIGIYRTTPDGRILDVSPALLQMLGYASVDELRSRNLEESGFQPEYSRQLFKDAIEREGEVRGFEAVWTTKEGRRLHVRENAHAIRGANGTILYYEGAVEDVTAEREAREALRRSEAQYRHLFESAGDAIMVFEPESETILDANPKACELYGYTHDELIGISLKSLTVDVGRGEKRMIDLLRIDQVQEFETVHLHRDGTPVYLEVSASAVDYGGRPAVLGTGRDITERKRVEEALKTSEEKYRRILENMEESYFEVDIAGDLTFFNESLCRLLGYPRDELMGMNNRQFTDEENARKVFQAFNKIYRTGESTREFNWEIIRKDGTKRHIEASASLRRDISDQPIGFYGIIHDVTERKQAEAEREKLEAQLRQVQKMEAVGQLAGGVAHDFNNLLQAMLSLTQVLLAHRADPERVAADAVELEQQVKHGAALTRQLLLFSRRETARPETLDLNEVVREAGKLLRRLLKANIAIESRLAEGKLPVEADRGQLEQVLFNLAVNGADAMPEGGRLTIATGSEGEEVWLQVADTGGGIPALIREHIFEPFFTTKEKGKGTGLGLAVVHGIVAQHGGRIGLESRERQGTTFTITFPRAGSGEHAAVKMTELAGEASRGRGEKVLLVEDEAAARNSLTEILTLLGYEVVAVGSGEEAGRLPAEPVFDVLLTDMMLPGIAGGDLARGLLDRWPKLKVILISGYTEDEAVRRGAVTGRVRFLQKPFDMAALAREIRAALDSD